MFHRYVYTCPDVIHMRRVARNSAIASVAIQVVFWGGLYVYGKTLEKKVENEIDEHENTNA